MATTTYVNFKRGLKHPKLSWMIQMLDVYGIAHRMITTATGPMLQIQTGSVEIASEILNQELVSFVALDKNVDNAVPVPITVVIDDLPNDHKYFEAQLTGKEIVPAETVVVEDFDAVEKDKRPHSDDLTELIVAGNPPIELDPEEDDEDEDDAGGIEWDFDDIDEDDEDDDTEAGPVIDVEATVTDTTKTDPEFEAGEAPEKPPKKRKEKPEPKEAVDPDFEAAETEGDLSAIVDGKEFLDVDEALPFEDITFPNVKDPVRMYDVDSSTVSALGAKILTKDPLIVTYYARFKSGATVYRYNPVSRSDYNMILNLAIRRHKGIQEASVGSFMYHTITSKANEGLIVCQRLTEDGKWVTVPPKSERTKQIKKRDS